MNENCFSGSCPTCGQPDLRVVIEKSLHWIGQALQEFEGNPGPSEIEGKNLHAELSRIFISHE